MDAWDEAYKVVFRQVKFDIFPRFRRSRAAAEWATLQLRRCLRSPAFCEAFCGEGSSTAFSPLQRQALDFYRAVLDYQSSYVALASGWPSDSSAQSAKRVYCAYEGAWAELGLPPDVHTVSAHTGGTQGRRRHRRRCLRCQRRRRCRLFTPSMMSRSLAHAHARVG